MQISTNGPYLFTRNTLRFMVISPEKLPDMSADELRDVVQSLLKTVSFKQATIDKLTHENAYLKRLKFAAQSERFSAEQRSLLEETLDEDLQAVNDEIEELSATDAPAPRVKDQPKRQPLPANLPRVEVQHEPDSTIENQIRPIAIGRNNWLFAGSLRAGKRAAAVMSLIQSARLNGHDPYAYLKDVLTRLPTQRASQIHELLPHRWQAPIQSS